MRKLVAAVVLVGSTLMGSGWAADEELPPVVVKKQSGFNYASGGVGELGRKAMAKIANKFPMQLVFTAEGQSDDLTGVKVTVRDTRGKTQIQAVSEGPYFYFTPDSGRWTMEAEYNGETLSKTVDLIGRRYILLEFHFKAQAEGAAR